MPCGTPQSDWHGTTSEDRGEIRALLADVQRLTRENDELREKLLRTDQGQPLTDGERRDIERHQIAHRRADLQRLERTFRQSRDYTRLGKVMLANASMPLGPQLGFSPDAF